MMIREHYASSQHAAQRFPLTRLPHTNTLVNQPRIIILHIHQVLPALVVILARIQRLMGEVELAIFLWLHRAMIRDEQM